jgi:hypothetical protein
VIVTAHKRLFILILREHCNFRRRIDHQRAQMGRSGNLVQRLLRFGIQERFALKFRNLAAIVVLGGMAAMGLRAASDDTLEPVGAAIITKYLEATQLQNQHGDPSMLLDINASVPKLRKQGTLRALRVMSNVGRITYRVLGFQGDNSVKKDVIARYLQADQQGQNDAGLALSPANYKFKFKGAKQTDNGQQAYVFQLVPRKKRVGLFKGELWLDAKSCLPVYEKGRLVKNPSIFFKKVDFERAFAIQNGVSVPARMNSTIHTRIVGVVELYVNYSSVPDDQAEEIAGQS